MENYPEGEIREMIEIYESKGMSTDDATLVIKTMAKYKEFFVDVMMQQELELQVPEEEHVKESMKEGTGTMSGACLLASTWTVCFGSNNNYFIVDAFTPKYRCYHVSFVRNIRCYAASWLCHYSFDIS